MTTDPDLRAKFEVAEAAMRRREAALRQGRKERRAIRAAAGGPCQATTKRGKACRRCAMGNQLCTTHGGKNAMHLWLASKRKGQSTEADLLRKPTTATGASS